MNFCSNCGHKVVFKAVEGDSIPRYVCDNCETIHYQNPKVITGALPIWEDKVLLCKRGISPRTGFWNVPGGYMENGESVEDGAVREVREETLSAVKIIGLHTLYSIPKINQVYMHFLADLQDLNFGPTIESLEVRLFTEEEIPWKEIAFTSSSFTIKKYFEDRRNGVRQVHTGKFQF